MGDEDVASFDLAGRPFVFVRGESTYRRALDGRLLERRPAGLASPRLRRVLDRASAEPILETLRVTAAEALDSLGHLGAQDEAQVPPPRVVEREAPPRAPLVAPDGLTGQSTSEPAERGPADATVTAPRYRERGEARNRLESIVAWDARARFRESERFAATWRHVGILPPDQYLSVVIEATEGCSWNECTFCELYRGVPFRLKTSSELTAHIAAVQEFFGEGLSLRRSVFVGSANALCAAPGRLLPLMEQVHAAFPDHPLTAFVDVATGAPRSVAHLEGYARAGLRRVYLGLETGSPELLRWLGKPGAPDEAVALVQRLRAAGVSVGIIVLVGAGGERFAPVHLAETTRILRAMELSRRDLVYLARLTIHPGGAYARSAQRDGVEPLDTSAIDAQCEGLKTSLPAASEGGPRMARYEVDEFVY
jgi:radical SAM superfamily enzyme YgiQ (UPF0313 family)